MSAKASPVTLRLGPHKGNTFAVTVTINLKRSKQFSCCLRRGELFYSPNAQERMSKKCNLLRSFFLLFILFYFLTSRRSKKENFASDPKRKRSHKHVWRRKEENSKGFPVAFLLVLMASHMETKESASRISGEGFSRALPAMNINNPFNVEEFSYSAATRIFREEKILFEKFPFPCCKFRIGWGSCGASVMKSLSSMLKA